MFTATQPRPLLRGAFLDLAAMLRHAPLRFAAQRFASQLNATFYQFITAAAQCPVSLCFAPLRLASQRISTQRFINLLPTRRAASPRYASQRISTQRNVS